MKTGLSQINNIDNFYQKLLLNHRNNLNRRNNSVDINNHLNRYSADINKIKFRRQNNLTNSLNIKNASLPTPTPKNYKKSFIISNLKSKYIILNNINSPILFKKFNQPFSQINRKNLFQNNSMNNINNNLPKKNINQMINLMKYKNLKINNSNSKPLFNKIFPENITNKAFKINNINNINKIRIKEKVYNKKILSNSDCIKQNSLNYCDASTNTNAGFDTNFLENKIYYNVIKEPKRPLMIDYFDSEHKKLYHGFDKFKGRKKYKIPFFIVYKY